MCSVVLLVDILYTDPVLLLTELSTTRSHTRNVPNYVTTKTWYDGYGHADHVILPYSAAEAMGVAQHHDAVS